MSTEIGTEGSDAAADGAVQAAAPQNNFERLTAHLVKDSLAVRLVSAYAAPGDGTPAQAVSDVITNRLDDLKKSYDNPEDQQN